MCTSTSAAIFASQHLPAHCAKGSRQYKWRTYDGKVSHNMLGGVRYLSPAEGVVVEQLDGIDDLVASVRSFAPGPGRRLGILVDHLVPGTKESAIAAAVRALPAATQGHALLLGHPYVDVWQSVKPARLGWTQWPVIPRGRSWKEGICQALGWPCDTPADLAFAWKRILGTVGSYADLEPTLLASVEELIDFVTAPGA